LPAQPRVLEERRRDDHPPLLVELTLRGAGEEVPLHHARPRRERVEVLDALGELLPGATRVREEAPVEAACDDNALLEGSAELRRECEAVLVVQGVLMFTEQHGPLRPTVSHYPPLVNPGGPLRSPRGRDRDVRALEDLRRACAGAFGARFAGRGG